MDKIPNKKSEYQKKYQRENKEKINKAQRERYKAKKEAAQVEKVEKLKTEEMLLKLYEKLDKIERQTAELELLQYQQSKSSTVIQPEPQEKKKIVVKSQTQEPETIENLSAEHKKLYEAFKKQQAKTQQAPSTTTTDYESESESEESDFEIDADGNII